MCGHTHMWFIMLLLYCHLIPMISTVSYFLTTIQPEYNLKTQIYLTHYSPRRCWLSQQSVFTGIGTAMKHEMKGSNLYCS